MLRPAGTVTIEVYFHVLTNSNGVGGLAEPTLKAQVDVLNAAFSGSDPDGPGANTPFRFVYAGMDKTANTDWFNMTYSDEPSTHEKAAKAELNKGGRSALNIYTAAVPGGPLGWTRWPWDFAKGVDGVVVRYSTLPGVDVPPFNKGDTLVHEVGHWLGLYHTFQGRCKAPGDSVSDTSPEEYACKDCPVSRNTCEGGFSDPIHNFMDYTTDTCMYQFTLGQSDRMDAVHLEYRTP